MLTEHFLEPLDKTFTNRDKKDDFYHAIKLFICKILDNKKPRNLQYIYMHPGGDYCLRKDLLTSPRVHLHRFKEMLCIPKLLLASNIPKPLDALALQWYYMSYHKNDRKKFILSGKTLDNETIESVTTFFQALYKQEKTRRND